jgi:hypothetical protein
MLLVSSMAKTDPGMAYRIFESDVIVTRSQSDDPRYYNTSWNKYPTQDPSDDVCRMDQRNSFRKHSSSIMGSQSVRLNKYDVL